MSFANLGLSAELLRAVSDEGYSEATPIQLQAIPAVLSGRDLLAAAQTGTGKTAAFTLPVLELLRRRAAPLVARQPRVLVMTPTRELCAQVGESIRTYGRHMKVRTAIVFGGVGFNPQADAMRHGLDVLVATPGRLLDHVQQRTLDLSRVEIVILDEADRMLDMGFIHDIKRILALLPRERQSLLFSATFSDDIRKLASGFLRNPQSVEVARRNAPTELVNQRVHFVDKARKSALLAHMIEVNNWQQTLVFTRTKHGANRLTQQLEKSGIQAAAIHGNKSQNARTRALADFKSNRLRVLVATDIAARGIDIDQLPQVVNFELPHVPEDYVHRIGRTGRAGATGEAVSLVSHDERDQLKDIQRLLGRTLPTFEVANFAQLHAANDARSGAAPQPQRGQPNGQQRQNGQQRGHGGGNNGNGGNGGNGGQRNGNGAQRHAGGAQRQGQPKSGNGARPQNGRGHNGHRPRPTGAVPAKPQRTH